jgi:hypothetical protein
MALVCPRRSGEVSPRTTTRSAATRNLFIIHLRKRAGIRESVNSGRMVLTEINGEFKKWNMGSKVKL